VLLTFIIVIFKNRSRLYIFGGIGNVLSLGSLLIEIKFTCRTAKPGDETMQI
jgi:hypothetical protein